MAQRWIEWLLTVDACLDGILDGYLKDLSLAPYFNHSTNLLLHFIGSSLVCTRCSLGDDLSPGQTSFTSQIG